MNQSPDWKPIPSGDSPERPASRQRSAGLLFSGVLIAVSLIAFVLPLAAYHVAQVAAVLRVRSSIFLLLLVSFALYAFGVVGQIPLFAMAGTTGLLCTPLLALVLTLRVRQVSVWWAFLILSLPVGFLLFSLMRVPQGFQIQEWLVAELGRLPERPGLNKEQLLQQLSTSQSFEPVQKLFNLTGWQRLAWFLFSESGALSLSVLASLFGTVTLIDFAFSQAERIRSVIFYVLQKSSEFPRQMVQLLEQTNESLTGLSAWISTKSSRPEQGPLFIDSHEKKMPPRPSTAKVQNSWQFLSVKIFRDPVPPRDVDVLGYRFHFSRSTGWNFRSFRVSLWAVIPALSLLVYLASRWQGEDEIAQWLPPQPLGEWLVWGGFAALAVITALALQGALVIHARLRPMPSLLFVLLTMALVSSLQGGAFSLVAVLAGLGLLDNAYDFRKRLAKT